jgi:hypothetical protein
MFRRLLLVFALAGMTAACATPYKTSGIMGGVDDLQLNENTFQITVRATATLARNASGTLSC